MAWETRERGGLYYTRSKKVNGRVVREYIGAGEVALLIARMDTEEREVRKARFAERAQFRNELDRIAMRVSEEYDRTEQVLRHSLEQAGYYRHKRGEWRKRRGAKRED